MIKTRALTAIALLPIAGLLIFNDLWRAPLLSFVLLLASWEWSRLAGVQTLYFRLAYVFSMAASLVAFTSFALPFSNIDILWLSVGLWGLMLLAVLRYPKTSLWSSVGVRLFLGYLTLLPVLLAFNDLADKAQGSTYILLLFSLVWSADIGAYFVGKRWGQTPLTLAVSPGKTREGMYGGLVAVLLLSSLFVIYLELNISDSIALILLSLSIGFISVLGDLFESMLKRHQGLKDSSNLLPGHGGVLDRIDSLLATAPCFALGLYLLNLG